MRPIDKVNFQIDKKGNKYYLNRKGAKVYQNILKNPLFKILEGEDNERRVYLLSVGIIQGQPVATIKENQEIICYRLPSFYVSWCAEAMSLVDYDKAMNPFPSWGVFGLNEQGYYVDLEIDDDN